MKSSVFENRCKKHALNWGLGLQSTCTIQLIFDDLLPRPDAIIFADPKYEREASYEVLEFWRPRIEEQGIPLIVVSAGDIRKNQIEQQRPEMPFWINPSRYETIEGKLKLHLSDVEKDWRKREKMMKRTGQISLFHKDLKTTLHEAATSFGHRVVAGEIKSGWMNMETTSTGRQCTFGYKIRPTQKFLRANFGASKKNPTGQWLGITTDEWTRMTKSRVQYTELFYPLITLGMSRDDCTDYLNDKGLPLPPKSACIGCPYHSSASWAALSREEIEGVAEFEQEMIEMIGSCDLQYKPYFANGAWTSKHIMPVDEIEFETKDEEEIPCEVVAGCFL